VGAEPVKAGRNNFKKRKKKKGGGVYELWKSLAKNVLSLIMWFTFLWLFAMVTGF